MKRWLIRAVLFIVVLEIIYLGVMNLALNLSYTQTLINQSKPEKFAVHWDSGWTLFPFKVHAKGISANGQSTRRQWQVKSPEASASISLLPLIFRTVSLRNIDVADVEYHQRPRPRPDKDYASIREYFPPIQDRELETQPVSNIPLKKGKKSWDIRIVNIHASGIHKVWFNQIQASLNGELQTDLSIQTRGGPFSLKNGKMDVTLDSLVINGNREVSREGHIKGKVEMLPFVPKENKGIKSLAFLNVDAKIDTEIESLAFLNLYLNAFKGMKVDGTGKLQGRIHLQQGKSQPGSDLKVSARKLGLDLFNYRVKGEGNISIVVPKDKPETHVTIEFGSLDAFDIDGQTLLFSGDGLAVNARGTTALIHMDDQMPIADYLAVSIPYVKVPDLTPYQRFLPDKWAFKLHGGEGELQAKIELSTSTFKSNLKLMSEDADVGFKDYRFQTNLDMLVNVDSPSLESGKFDISGTHFVLNDAKLSDEDDDAEPWHASINIEKGIVRLNLDEAEKGVTGAKHFKQELKEIDFKSLLASADEELKISGRISDLRWLNLLLKNPYDLAIGGKGEIAADVVVTSGWVGEGTHLTVTPQELIVDVLDYRAKGGGGVEFKVTKGGQFPDMALDVALTDAQFSRKGDEQAFIEDVDIKLQALGKGMKLDGAGENVELRLHIPSAKIHDMSVYNQYLPENSPLQVLGGEASLVADILLKPADADGYVRLTSNGLRSRIDDQEVEGELTADIKLVDGVPKNMDFDISGSSLLLDRVKVVGEQKEFRDTDWSARFDLTKAKAVWKKPVRLDLEAELEMTDSMPIVSVIANQRGKHGWLGKALTIDDVSGEVRLQMADNQIVIPYAFADSDKIDVGAKGIINKESRNGVLYVRFRKLHGILKIKDGDRNIDILNAREKFDQYDTNAVLSKFSTGNTPARSNSKAHN